MKKRIWMLFVAIALLVGLVAVTAYAQQDTFVAYCEHCQMETVWTPLETSTQSMSGGGHFYLSSGMVMTGQAIGNGKTVCLNLNGLQYIANKPISVTSGGLMHIQNGTLKGRGNTVSNVKYGTFRVLDGGTLKATNVDFIWDAEADREITNGGIGYIAGEVILDNCTVADSRATELGGNFYILPTGALTLNNTTVTGGKIGDDAAHSARCIYSEGQVRLSGNSSVELLRIGNNAKLADALVLEDGYTGSLNLHFDTVPAYGTDIGNLFAEGADIRKAQIVVTNAPLEVYTDGANLVVDEPPAAQVNGVRYTTLEEAMAAAGAYPLELCKDAASITVTKDLTLDLAGCNVGALTAAEGVTVSVIDIKTADYDIENGFYGKVGTASGNVVAGADAENIYLPMEEADGTSYHALRMAVNSVSLRPGDAAVYFDSDFLGDSKVKALVSSFGVALSVDGEPDEAAVKAGENCTVFTNDQFNTGADITSSLVTGILKDTNNLRTNNRNAAMDIYGVPYVKCVDGTVLLGEAKSSSMRKIIDAVEAKWETLGSEQQNDMMDMYLNLENVMGTWELPVLRPAVIEREEKTIRILTIGNSHGQDANWQLREVFLQHDPDRRVVVGVLYYSGCTIKQHVQFAEGNQPVYRYHKNVDGTWVTQMEATMLDGLQDERWDIVVLQEASYELGIEANFQNNNLQKLIDYVKANVNGEPEFGFNTEFTSPFVDTYTNPETAQTAVPENFVSKHEKYYNLDQQYMYECMIANTQKYICSNDTFNPQYIIPAATVMQYANNMMDMTDLDLYRDYVHASEMGRLMISYLMYCQLTGDTLDSIDDIKVNEIPQHLRHTRYTSEGALVITDAMKKVILESVNYTLENPFTVPEAIEQEDPGADNVINVLMIGNSFCNYYPDELKAMADAAGKKLDVYNVYYGGCKLSQHYKFLKNDLPEYSFKKNGVKQKDEVTLWYCISQKNWDYISLQEGSAVLRDAASAQAGMDSNLKYFSHMYEYVKQRCPKSQIIWHQTWAYQVGKTSGGYLTKDAAQQAAYHERLYTYAEMITEKYPDLLLVNSGDAWAIIRETGYDKLCNRLGKTLEGVEHAGDNYHEGDIGGGQYLNACVWYEVLFGESCVGNTFRPDYKYNNQSMEMLIDVETLQQAAHQAVTTRNAN